MHIDFIRISFHWQKRLLVYVIYFECRIYLIVSRRRSGRILDPGWLAVDIPRLPGMLAVKHIEAIEILGVGWETSDDVVEFEVGVAVDRKPDYVLESVE